MVYIQLVHSIKADWPLTCNMLNAP